VPSPDDRRRSGRAIVANTHLKPVEPDEKDVRRARRQLAEALRHRGLGLQEIKDRVAEVFDAE